MPTTRQLAAIMFTDIVGYTALMGENSEKALELVRVSKEIQKPLVVKHHGKWLKEMGDGVLVQFNTALDAVNCAIEIQENARAKFDGKLRIGIHLGDITIENEDVYGDGVNVASRLESIADPGGIYISDAILKAIQGHRHIQTKYLGEISLKNVSYQLRTYAVQGAGLPVPIEKEKNSRTGESKSKQRLVLVLAIAAAIILVLFFIKPVLFKQNELSDIGEVGLAIMPLKNISSRSDIDFLSYALKDEIHEMLALSKKFAFLSSAQATAYYKDKEVTPQTIGDELGVDYMLSGSYQIAGDQLNVSVEFSDVLTGNTVWFKKFTEKYDEANIFPIQADIARKVLELFDQDDDIAVNKRPINFESYSHYAKGLELTQKSLLHKYQLMAIEEFEKAIELDSSHTQSWLKLFNIKSRLIFESEEKYDYFLPELEEHLNHLSNNHPQWAIEIAKGIEEYYVLKNYQGALDHFYNVIDAYPDNELANAYISFIYKRQHRIQDAYDITIKLIGSDPKNVSYWNNLSALFEINGDFDRSLQAYLKTFEFGRDSTHHFRLSQRYERASIPVDSIPSQYRTMADKYYLASKIYSFNNPIEEKNQLKYIPLDSVKKGVSTYTIVDYHLDMAHASFGLYQDDSVAYYANLCIEANEKEKKKQWWAVALAYSLLGDYDKSVEIRKQAYNPTIHNEDLHQQSSSIAGDMWWLAASKNYQELTNKLIELNREYPEFGNYPDFNYYVYERAKKEYPPLAEAVANLKLPAPLVEVGQLDRLNY